MKEKITKADIDKINERVKEIVNYENHKKEAFINGVKSVIGITEVRYIKYKITDLFRDLGYTNIQQARTLYNNIINGNLITKSDAYLNFVKKLGL